MKCKLKMFERGGYSTSETLVVPPAGAASSTVIWDQAGATVAGSGVVDTSKPAGRVVIPVKGCVLVPWSAWPGVGTFEIRMSEDLVTWVTYVGIAVAAPGVFPTLLAGAHPFPMFRVPGRFVDIHCTDGAPFAGQNVPIRHRMLESERDTW